MRPMIERCFVLLLGGVMSLALGSAAPAATEPDPSLTPEQVIAIQVEALKANRDLPGDEGITIAFNFASPANRKMTGPLPRFIEMVKNPLYAIMLNFEQYETAKIELDGDIARQRVTLIDAAGNRSLLLFVLSRQKEAPYKDCWMTDVVQRVNPAHEKPLVAQLFHDSAANF
ncbi:MAG: DUF4864 domain-containing protein [Acidobacteria bacterium]|nr:DUF4864 domain-containing protein [Acidobacteriota bacterium]